jgi:hypothetical protein
MAKKALGANPVIYIFWFITTSFIHKAGLIKQPGDNQWLSCQLLAG